MLLLWLWLRLLVRHWDECLVLRHLSLLVEIRLDLANQCEQLGLLIFFHHRLSHLLLLLLLLLLCKSFVFVGHHLISLIGRHRHLHHLRDMHLSNLLHRRLSLLLLLRLHLHMLLRQRHLLRRSLWLLLLLLRHDSWRRRLLNLSLVKGRSDDGVLEQLILIDFSIFGQIKVFLLNSLKLLYED